MLLEKIKDRINVSFHGQEKEIYYQRKDTSLKSKKNITYIILGVFILFTAGQIGTRVLNTYIYTKRYNIEYGTEIKEYSTIDDFEIEYADYDDSDIVEANQAIINSIMYLSNDYSVEYSMELDEENEYIDNFQINYTVTDDLNRDWKIYYNNEDQNLQCTITNQENTLSNVINVNMIQSLYVNLYKSDTVPADLYTKIIEAGDVKEWYYSCGFVKIDINIDEESTEMIIYPN